jgi:hypothetical protein
MMGRRKWYGEHPDELLDLARLLYEEMERLDPTPDLVPFDDLRFFDKELYRCAAKAILVRIKSKSVTRPTIIS